MVEVAAALENVLNRSPAPPLTTELSLLGALGRIAGRAGGRATSTRRRSTKALMDGYAVRSADTAGPRPLTRD